MTRIIKNKRELRELVEEMRKDMERDGHEGVLTEWIIEVILDHPEEYEVKGTIASIISEAL